MKICLYYILHYRDKKKTILKFKQKIKAKNNDFFKLFSKLLIDEIVSLYKWQIIQALTSYDFTTRTYIYIKCSIECT